MKYSIIISPNHKNSNAVDHAMRFIGSILKQDASIVSVFFYGYAVENAFVFDSQWQKISEQDVLLYACSNIADNYLNQQQKVAEYIDLVGLGQWMESVFDANKSIEFR